LTDIKEGGGKLGGEQQIGKVIDQKENKQMFGIERSKGGKLLQSGA